MRLISVVDLLEPNPAARPAKHASLRLVDKRDEDLLRDEISFPD